MMTSGCSRFLFVAGLLAGPACAAPDTEAFIDPRDGQTYPLVEVAGMTWMARNLNFAAPGSFCYGDDPERCAAYGRLYRWESATKACPDGWHLASELEWQALELAAGLSPTELVQRNDRGTVEGARLKAGGDLGFEIQYSGWRRYDPASYEDGVFAALGRASALWTSAELDLAHAWHRHLDTDDDMIWRSPVVKNYALAVRCIQDRHVEDEYAGQDTHPAWSPDGTRLAYISNREGVRSGREINFEIYILDPATKREHRLTVNDAFEADIAWSPDGSRIAFKTYRDGNDEVYVMAADGSNPVNLTRHPASDGGPSFSPDGKSIVFASDRAGRNEIYRMRADGSDVRRLGEGGVAGHSPQWSPDGSRIAFVSDRDGNDEIYTMAADGSDLRRVTHSPLADWYPRWSPDGTWLAITYGDWETDAFSVVLIRPDGSERRVLQARSDSGNVTWRRDGKAIAFGASDPGKEGARSGAPGRIHVMMIDGAGPQAITGRGVGTFE